MEDTEDHKMNKKREPYDKIAVGEQTYCERVKIWGKIFSVTNMIMK